MSVADDEEPSPRLRVIVEREAARFLQRRSLLILEAAISAMMDGFSDAEVIRILREHAQHLEDHG